jgi:hypothetical protein
MEAILSVSQFPTITRRNILEDRRLHTRGRENWNLAPVISLYRIHLSWRILTESREKRRSSEASPLTAK